jgi:predicted nucleic acid-binding protein
MSIIADSGPILSFARANHLALLQQVVGDLTIPDAVYDDIVVQGMGKPGSREVQGASWIHLLPVRDRMFVDQLPPRFHLGEREAIALAKEQGAVLLVDEREARREALRQGLTVMGSLRVLREAKTRGVIPQSGRFLMNRPRPACISASHSTKPSFAKWAKRKTRNSPRLKTFGKLTR